MSENETREALRERLTEMLSPPLILPQGDARDEVAARVVAVLVAWYDERVRKALALIEGRET